MRYFLELSYKGTRFNGWQRQLNAPSVQLAIEEALSTILRDNIEITGAGRTDTGVHAAYYVAHFDTDEAIGDGSDFCYHLNSILHKDISAHTVARVAGNAHARYDALRREYKYYITYGKDPFSREFSWQTYRDLDIDAMNEAAAALYDFDDFTTFCKLHSGNKTNICNIYNSFWERDKPTIIYTLSADRFLRNMVRSIVSTLFDVGIGKITPEDFREIIASRDLSRASGSAPAQGLFLTDIVYPDNIFQRTI